MIDPGCDLESSRKAVSYAAEYPHVYAAVGIHPENCAGFTPAHIDALRALAPGRRFLVIEQNTGQMVEDVRLSLMGENARVDWHGVMPGLFIGADALEDPIRQACKEN